MVDIQQYTVFLIHFSTKEVQGKNLILSSLEITYRYKKNIFIWDIGLKTAPQ